MPVFTLVDRSRIFAYPKAPIRGNFVLHSTVFCHDPYEYSTFARHPTIFTPDTAPRGEHTNTTSPPNPALSTRPPVGSYDVNLTLTP